MSIPMKPNDVTWTDDQWRAIYESGSDILVAAAAGSGKTAVLVERIIQKILDETNPINVDELLVATFTNASAAEMRHRIGVALEKEITNNPQSHHLRRQLNLLNNAAISTLHSFCLNVVRKYYYLIDIDPAFRIADETEGLLLRDEALEILLEEEYGRENNEDFFRVVDIFTGDRSDQELQKLILSLYDFSRANPDPETWLQELVKIYDVNETTTKVDDLPFIKPLLFDIDLQLKESIRLFEEALELTRQPGGPDRRAENFIDDIQIATRLLSAKAESFQSLYDAFQTYKFTTLKPAKGDEYDKELVDRSTKLRNKGKDIIQKLKDDLFSRKPQTFLRDMEEMKKPIETLVYLVQSFSMIFNNMKKEKGLVDFNDLEHYALKILTSVDPETGEKSPSAAALVYRKQFKEVFIDEYQDTNMVQESILQLIKRPEEKSGNLFMVGDVKQSIYRFRLAEPNLFLSKYRRFTKDGEKTGLKIDLSQNFRSRKEVLSGTNYLFKQIMGIEVGEIEYDSDAELKKGAAYPEEAIYPIEVAILHKGTDDRNEQDQTDSEEELDIFGKEELEQSEMESRYVSKKIRELIKSGQQVYDTKTKKYRDIQYKDIVILLRSFTWAPQFMEEFKEQGIPVYANISTGYFEAAEVSTMVALLKVIDNPYQDIPVAAVLRSPIYGLTEEELSIIRIHAKRVTFFEAVTAYLEKNPKDAKEEELFDKLIHFQEQLNKWRTIARQGSLSDLIWQLYRDTHFYDYVGGLPGGKQRQANLRAFYDRARGYESTSFRGLFRFLRFIEKMQSRGEDLGVARALGEQEDVVRIMTIHSSKGLEFPVVFVSGLGRQFNMMDLRKSYLFDKEYGFATNYVNPEKQITYPSLFHISLSKKKRLELVAEEMRVLYVALTRAKEKLYLIGSTKNFDKLIDKWQKHLDVDEWLLPDYDRMVSTSYLDWVGPALIRHRDCSSIIKPENLGKLPKIISEVVNHPSLWKIDIYAEDTLLTTAEEDEDEENLLQQFVQSGQPVPVSSTHFEEVKKQLSWEYEEKLATLHRSKQSVSELKRLREVRDVESGEDIVRSFKKPIVSRPKFMQEKKLTPAEIGTAMHMVMQHIDLTQKPSHDSIQLQISNMVAKELLSDQEAENIDIDNIIKFFETDIGERVLKADWVKREVPFSFTLHAKEVYPNWEGKDEPVFIQGIIDCLFQDEDGLVLLDYKTDQIKSRFPEGFDQARPVLSARYETQIALYRRAVQTILNQSLNGTYLYFFDGGYLLDHTPIK